MKKAKFFTTLSILLLICMFSITSMAATAVTWPVPQSKRITQHYKAGVHLGVDIGAATAGVAGNNIVAMYKGKVGRSGWSSSYGWVVYIFHEGTNRIDGQNIQSRYAHMRDTPLVSAGQNVSTGTRIGYMGRTGDATGVHLHFETRVCSSACDTTNNSTPKNPLSYYPGISSVSETSAVLDVLDHDYFDEEEVFYSLEEILEMTQEEREAKGIPEPYQYSR